MAKGKSKPVVIEDRDARRACCPVESMQVLSTTSWNGGRVVYCERHKQTFNTKNLEAAHANQ